MILTVMKTLAEMSVMFAENLADMGKQNTKIARSTQSRRSEIWFTGLYISGNCALIDGDRKMTNLERDEELEVYTEKRLDDIKKAVKKIVPCDVEVREIDYRYFTDWQDGESDEEIACYEELFETAFLRLCRATFPDAELWVGSQYEGNYEDTLLCDLPNDDDQGVVEGEVEEIAEYAWQLAMDN